MIPQEGRSPPHGECGGLEKHIDDLDASSIPKPVVNVTRRDDRVRRARLELLRDSLHEALGFAKLYADVAQSLAEVGDDAGTLYALGNFHAAAKLACQAGRDIRELKAEAGLA